MIQSMAQEIQNEPVLSINNLSFAYSPQDSRVIEDISIEIKRTEIISVLGASGCGKTTLLNLISGLLRPYEGQIKIRCGRMTAGLSQPKEQTSIGYIFQRDPLLPWRTVKGNILLAKDLNKVSDERELQTRVSEYLKKFQLSEDILAKYPSQLSGGMRQRVSIIQALMFDPELLLLDEPFSALDFYTKISLEKEFWELIKSEKRSAILVTHDIDEAIAMSDRVLIMDNSGRINIEFKVDLTENGGQRSPETVRGTPAFANLYKKIWTELRTVIAQ